MLAPDVLARLDDLPRGSRVLTRLASDGRLAELLLELYRRELVAVPLDPRIPWPEAAQLGERVGGALTIYSEQDRLALRPGPADAGSQADSAGLAYVIFTSGSTGSPKGVTLTRRAVELNADWTAALHGFGPDRPHGTCLPLYHVNALMMSLLGTHRAGGSLVLAPPTPRDYFAALAEAGAATASIVPALLHRLVEEAPPWPDRLEYLITAAAPLSSELAGRFFERYGPRLRQGYGLSEAVNFSFTMPLLDAEGFRSHYLERVPPVGLPVGDTQWRLVDGEVLIRTAARTHGYWQDAATTEQLIDADGWLHTGDLGERRGDYLVLTGRRAEVINRGGEKLYPRDVERQWAQAGVSAVAVAVPAGDYGHEIGAVVEGSDISALLELGTLTHLRPAAAELRAPTVTATGKPRRSAMARTLVVHPQPPQRYAELLRYAAAVARQILADPARPRTAQANLLSAHAALLAHRVADAHGPVAERSPAHDALDLVQKHWRDFACGDLSGEQLIRQQPGLWKQLMIRWPMGDYAELVADVVRNRVPSTGTVLELGTGVGNTTRLLAEALDDRLVWSDLSEPLVARGGWPGRGLVLDFDRPLPAEVGEPAAVFACNALHCSADPLAALRRIRTVLPPGGILILGEGGTPTTADGVPWALDFLFCLFDGWWNRSGFRPRSEWLRLLTAAGFEAPGYSALRYGRHDCGGALWAYRPDDKREPQ